MHYVHDGSIVVEVRNIKVLLWAEKCIYLLKECKFVATLHVVVYVPVAVRGRQTLDNADVLIADVILFNF